MMKFILPAAILLTFMISSQAFACDPVLDNFSCEVEVVYQGTSFTNSGRFFTKLEIAQEHAKADACKTLCKGEETCVSGCLAEAEFPILRCEWVDGCAGWLGGKFLDEGESSP